MISWRVRFFFSAFLALDSRLSPLVLRDYVPHHLLLCHEEDGTMESNCRGSSSVGVAHGFGLAGGGWIGF